ncbi:MAG: DVU0298 family protein [Thermodesulfobacteriota bacterium]
MGREREIKRRLQSLLIHEDIDHVLRELAPFSPQELIGSLVAGLYRTDERVKWHTVTVLGAVMNRLARQEKEAARIVMRRLLWSMNEESGGIGWGIPEAMGEIMAVTDWLADEYAHLLVSYMREENYLELPALQHGLMWGIGRLAMVRPELLLHHDADGHMAMYLESADPVVIGLACRNFGILRIREAAWQIRSWCDSTHPLTIYENRVLRRVTVGELARQALSHLQPN